MGRSNNYFCIIEKSHLGFYPMGGYHFRYGVDWMTNKPLSFGQKLGLSRGETAALARLKTPEKIQDYISNLQINKELQGDTCLSVRDVLRHGHAHCIEGAFVAAAALWINGEPPLLMDMKAKGDDDHVITLFRHRGLWGAISKSNHVWLRWRDPVYRSLRELAMSYLHEYTAKSNRISLRAYSRAFDLRRQDPALWVTNKESCWDVAWYLDQSRHYPLVTSEQARRLRPHDIIEIIAGKLVEYP
jgi:hypothetical protein